MLSFIYLALVGSATLVGCMPHQFSLSLSLEGDTDALPYQQSPQILAGTSPPAYIVPLSKYARVGKVDVDVEEGTIALLGPRFVNAFYKETPSGEFGVELDVKCFLNCGKTLVTALPCLFAALAAENPLAALACVPSKSDLCDCISCMPDVVGGWIQKNLCDSSLDIKETAIASSFNYRDFTNLASSSLEFAAFRGDLYEYQGTQIGNLNGGFNAVSINSTSVASSCFIGSLCGEKCCVGPCVVGVCVGFSYG